MAEIRVREYFWGRDVSARQCRATRCAACEAKIRVVAAAERRADFQPTAAERAKHDRSLAIQRSGPDLLFRDSGQ